MGTRRSIAAFILSTAGCLTALGMADPSKRRADQHELFSDIARFPWPRSPGRAIRPRAASVTAIPSAPLGKRDGERLGSNGSRFCSFFGR